MHLQLKQLGRLPRDGIIHSIQSAQNLINQHSQGLLSLHAAAPELDSELPLRSQHGQLVAPSDRFMQSRIHIGLCRQRGVPPPPKKKKRRVLRLYRGASVYSPPAIHHEGICETKNYRNPYSLGRKEAVGSPETKPLVWILKQNDQDRKVAE
jgi:hypothetical protein